MKGTVSKHQSANLYYSGRPIPADAAIDANGQPTNISQIGACAWVFDVVEAQNACAKSYSKAAKPLANCKPI